MVGKHSNRIARDELEPGDHIYSWRRPLLYAHHGIYVGDGNVTHFTAAAGGIRLGRSFHFSSASSSRRSSSHSTSCPRCGDRSRSNDVISSCLECFLSGGKLYRYRYGVSSEFFLAQSWGGTCTTAASNPTELVLHRAEYLLRHDGFGKYDLAKNNCEDFAIYCKTGLLSTSERRDLGQSGQVASYLGVLNGVGTAVMGAVMGVVQDGRVSGLKHGMRSGSDSSLQFRVNSDVGARADSREISVEDLVSEQQHRNNTAT